MDSTHFLLSASLSWRKILILRELAFSFRSEEHTSELQSQSNIVCRLLLEKKKLVVRMKDQAGASAPIWLRAVLIGLVRSVHSHMEHSSPVQPSDAVTRQPEQSAAEPLTDS